MAYGFKQVYGAEGLGTVSGVVSALPAGCSLGDKREENGLVYRLCYNAGNSAAYPGHAMSAVPIKAVTSGAGDYSMTVTTVSGAWNGVNACVVHNATATTGTYFWGVTKGRLTSGLVCNAAASASTGGAVTIDSAGGVAAVTTMSLSNPPIAITFASLTTGSTTPSRTGDVNVIIED